MNTDTSQYDSASRNKCLDCLRNDMVPLYMCVPFHVGKSDTLLDQERSERGFLYITPCVQRNNVGYFMKYCTFV